MLPTRSRLSLPAQPAEEDHDPEGEPDDQQHLPEAPEVEVLEALVAEDRDLETSCGCRPARRSGCRATTTTSAPSRAKASLPGRAAPPGDHRRQEDPGRHERGRDEEDRELHVPGADQVEGQRLGDVDPEEAPEVGPVVLGGSADHGLEQEEACHRKKEPGRRPLGRSQGHVPGQSEAELRLLPTLPAEPSSGRRPRTGSRSRRAARSARRPTRRPRWRSARCPPAARLASCSCRSSCDRGAGPRPPSSTRRRTRSAGGSARSRRSARDAGQSGGGLPEEAR